jgi:hypothetical protein
MGVASPSKSTIAKFLTEFDIPVSANAGTRYMLHERTLLPQTNISAITNHQTAVTNSKHSGSRQNMNSSSQTTRMGWMS